MVASARLESCALGKECVILLFKKEYAGLRVKNFNIDCILLTGSYILLYVSDNWLKFQLSGIKNNRILVHP